MVGSALIGGTILAMIEGNRLPSFFQSPVLGAGAIMNKFSGSM